MKNFAINQQFDKINKLISATRESTNDNLELQAHWAKYICVLTAGFLENALAQVYSDFTKECSPNYIHSHVSQYLSRIQNPKATKFVEVAKSFKSEWGVALQSFVEDEGRSEAIGNIMKNRHLVAHGKTSQITISQITTYLSKSVEVLNFIENQCQLKHPTTEVK